MKRWILCGAALLCAAFSAAQKMPPRVWEADCGDNTYRNPVLYADYSDPDIIRVGDDYWLTASSFCAVPGLQILHSTDLVNWTLAGAALPRLYDAAFDRPSHGNGVWAPSIRYHEGKYYIYWGDPDRGIYMTSTDDPRGAWSEPCLVKAAKGIIDTCPLWDDDGRAYLVHGWAGSRAGFKSVLCVSEMSPDGTRLLGEDILVFDGHRDHPTVEGPKFYKRHGYYYIFAPAGGVKTGWQIVLRSRSPFGPYECRTVLHQGATATPAPHQGAWVEDTAGESWFAHFVDCYAYGRVMHLQPMRWTADDWCIIGEDIDADGVGEPVERWRKPASRVATAVAEPASSDDFTGCSLGLQWQWQANPAVGWYLLNPSEGALRLNCVAHESSWHNLADNGNLLLQKVNAPDMTATVHLRLTPSYEGDRAGLILFGHDYAVLQVALSDGALTLERVTCTGAIKRGTQEVTTRCRTLPAAESAEVWLRCRIRHATAANGTPEMQCLFSYSLDGKRFAECDGCFVASAGEWVSAKIGLFADAVIRKNDGGRADIFSFAARNN